jgi:hypothetical protein
VPAGNNLAKGAKDRLNVLHWVVVDEVEVKGVKVGGLVVLSLSLGGYSGGRAGWLAGCSRWIRGRYALNNKQSEQISK